MIFRYTLLLLGILSWFSVSSQNQVTGKVTDQDGITVPGATIVIKGTSIFTTTDDLGHFQLSFDEPLPVILEFNSLGFEVYEWKLDIISGEPLTIQLQNDSELMEVLVTARRRAESAQDIPVPITVINAKQIEEAGNFNVNRLKEMVPSVQLYSSNPRNTGLSIRGLGTTFGLTNDGIDPGVGFYIDGVYYVRTAATTIDFLDVGQVEVLRGPQGTLFGKNTVAGAFNVTTRKPSFTKDASVELSIGNFGYVQGKASLTGPIAKKFAGRLSFSGTTRNGTIYNTATDEHVNTLNNLGLRGQLLYQPGEKTEVRLSGDFTSQRPVGYAQVFAGVAPTLRAEYRQFEQIIDDLEYEVPNRDPFDREIDHDTPWQSDQDFGGVSVNVDSEMGPGTFTSTTAWRFWQWGPSNDRDFTGLPVLALSQAPSIHHQWSQEFRYAGTFSDRWSGVIGLFAFGQTLNTDPYHTEESGAAQWRFSQNTTSDLWQTPGLLDGYGIRTTSALETFSGAIFGQIDYSITKKLRVLPGLRLNYDEKKVDFNRVTYGGLDTSDPALLAIKRSVYSDQAFNADVNNTNLSGQLTIAYDVWDWVQTYVTYSTGYKPVGINLGGLPTANGQPLLELAVIKPEDARHFEVGFKSTPVKNSILNITLYNTQIKDYQTQVQTADLSVNRGYLANAEEVRVRGVELDGSTRLGDHFNLYGAAAYTEGIYITFTNAPPPLEETGGPTFKDISGSELPGISKWAGSLGLEFTQDARVFSAKGEIVIAADVYARSTFSSNPSPSTYLVVDGYGLLNARIGFRAVQGISVFAWGRNLLNQNYFEQLLPASGNAGHYAGVLGDPGTVGVTIKYDFFGK